VVVLPAELGQEGAVQAAPCGKAIGARIGRDDLAVPVDIDPIGQLDADSLCSPSAGVEVALGHRQDDDPGAAVL
jgi:hypothetical protein